MRCGVAFASLLLMRHSCLICVKEELADLRDEVLNLRGAVATMETMLFNLVAKFDALEAKEQLLTGVAKYFEALRDCIDQETKRHSDALAMITYKGVGASFHNAVNETMEAAAENLTDSGEEQAPEPGAAVAGAGSSTDMACPKCSKICKGDKGVRSRLADRCGAGARRRGSSG